MNLKVTTALRKFVSGSFASLAILAALSATSIHAQSADARTTIATRTAASIASATDAGLLPSAQRISLTLTLTQPEDRAAALQQYLTDLTTPKSDSYHKWLTPAQFATTYGATPDQLAAATTWAQSQGLTVDSVSPSALRLTISGTTTQLQSAFSVSLHAYQLFGAQYFASTTLPSLPASTASLFSAIDGLDNLPANSTLSASYISAKGSSTTSAVTLSSLADIVDQNLSPIVTLSSALCTADLAPAQVSEYTALLRQASAQGITTIASRDCPSGSFPAALPEVTAVSAPSASADTTSPIAARPSWQAAPGLPSDALRYAPDLTAASLTSFAQTIAAIEQKSGRLGNINTTLYSLAPTPGLYTQPDSATDTWEPATGLGLVDLAVLAKAFPQGTTAVTMNFYSSNGAPIHGQTFTLTATINSTTGGAVPTGTVTFSATQAAFNSMSVNLDGGGNATTPAYQLPGGAYTITANYPGDTNYAANSTTINLTVSPEAAAYTITAPATATLGSTVTATVTLKSNSGFGTPAASGTITPFGLNNTGPVNLAFAGSNGTATGSATFTINKAGSITFESACYPQDSNFTCNGAQDATTTVAHVTPTVTLSLNPAAPAVGQSTTLTAVVAATGGIAPTGTVTFFDGTTQLGTGTAPSATYTTTLTPGVTHSLYATYQGDDNYGLSNSNTVTPAVTAVATTTAVTASASSITYGTQLTLNVKVTPAAVVNGTQPAGPITITGAGTTTINATATGGAVSVPISGLPIGTYTIATNYGGDPSGAYTASVGNTVPVTVTAAVGSLMTNISSNSFTTGSTATLTVTVTLPNNGQLPSGSTFQANILTIASAVYTGTFNINPGGNTGTGQVTIPAPIAGSYTLEVTCPKNAAFTCTAADIPITSTSSTGGAPGGTGTTATTTTLTSNPSPPVAGQSVILTATIAASATATAANPIAGTVTFYDGTTVLGSPVVVSTSGANAVASTVVSLSTAGHTLTAIYNGNTIYATSTSTAITVGSGSVGVSPAAITLTSNVTSGTAGQSVVLTAKVTGLTAAGASPTGSVNFYTAGSSPALLATVPLTAAGSGIALATFSTTAFPAGTTAVYAVYSGDGNFTTVTSANITIGIGDYSVTFVSPTILNLTQGQTGTVSILLTDLGGYTGTVAFSCTAPTGTGIGCTFNPSSLTASGPTTLTVATTAAKASLTRPSLFGRALTGGITLATLLCLLLPGRNRRRIPALLLVLLTLGLATNLGCGSSLNSATGLTGGGTPFGTTILTINTAGTDGTTTIHHNYSYQVTVQ